MAGSHPVSSFSQMCGALSQWPHPWLSFSLGCHSSLIGITLHSPVTSWQGLRSQYPGAKGCLAGFSLHEVSSAWRARAS